MAQAWGGEEVSYQEGLVWVPRRNSDINQKDRDGWWWELSSNLLHGKISGRGWS